MFSKIFNRRANKVWEHWYGEADRAYDICDTEIERAAYGDRKSEYGWEIDYIRPKSHGGKSNMHNLRPLHWRNNDTRGDLSDGQWRLERARSAQLSRVS